MNRCCICDEPGKVATSVIDGVAYMVCAQHFALFLRSDESLSLREWCKHATSWPRIDGRRVIGKTWLCDWFDAMAVGS